MIGMETGICYIIDYFQRFPWIEEKIFGHIPKTDYKALRLVCVYLKKRIDRCPILNTCQRFPIVMEEIFRHIPRTDYKSLRQVCVYFKQIVQLQIERLETECEQRIEMRRQNMLEWVFNKHLPRMKRDAPWPSWVAWHQQTMIHVIGDYRYYPQVFLIKFQI
jgi:hypothetical protein